MNLYNFITHKEIETVSKNIKNETDFEIEKDCKEYRFRLNSSRAGVDFDDGTKEGDYIVGIGFSASSRGWGMPISGESLRELKNVDELRKYIDKHLGESRIEGYETIEEGQISLFEMMI